MVYCVRNRSRPALANRIQLAFEESVHRLLVPALESPRIRAAVEYSGETEDAVWTIRYGGPRFDPLGSADDLALAVLKGAAAETGYAWTEDDELPNRMVLKIRSA